jgi:thioredoxin-related protein
MKRRMILVFSLFFIFLYACFSDSVSSTERIKWISYNEGMTAGGKEGKKIFLSFYADWCTFCAKMDKETFKDPAIVKYLNEHFINIKIDTEKENEIARKHFVRGLPMTWFLESNGDKISSLPGYIPPDMFLQILKYIETDSYKKMTFKEYSDSLEKKK